MTVRVQAVGECMLEFARTATGINLAYAGDTYNTAVYLSRVSRQLELDVDVRFLTGVGSDRESVLMRQSWHANGVEDDAKVVPAAAPGAYLIATDADGERTFTYWRANSAAAQLFAGTAWLADLDADWIYLSGVTLQLMPSTTRQALADRLRVLRGEGARVAFDSNYRPAGWTDPGAAADAMRTIMRRCDLVLVTLEDEIALGNGHDLDTCVASIQALGAPEVAVKIGAGGVVVATGGDTRRIPTESVPAIDTTGAGDSFNGAYIAARLAGVDPEGAARLGNSIAGRVITRPGAIIPSDTMPSCLAITSRPSHSRARHGR